MALTAQVLWAFGMNPKVGGSRPLRSRHFLSLNLRHFHKNIRSWVKIEWWCSRPVNISNVNYFKSFDISYIHVPFLRIQSLPQICCYHYRIFRVLFTLWSDKLTQSTYCQYMLPGRSMYLDIYKGMCTWSFHCLATHSRARSVSGVRSQGRLTALFLSLGCNSVPCLGKTLWRCLSWDWRERILILQCVGRCLSSQYMH